MVRRGSGTVVIGGGKTTAPGEIRGESIEGGELHELKEGSTVHVPPQNRSRGDFEGRMNHRLPRDQG